MKKIVLILLFINSLFASVNVETTYATFGEITKRIGADLVNVKVLGSSKYDPHFIVPKPSLLSKLRRTDLLIINGAGLEIGWLPPLIRNANNQKIQTGASGFLDISHYINLIDKPQSISRAFGDVHSDGNPHYILDPHVILIVAKVIANKLAEIDSSNKERYLSNLENFRQTWKLFLKKFDAKMSMCKNKNVVQYHALFNYFLKRYNFKSYGNVEPLPGISPSSKHTIELINTIEQNGVKHILQDVYHEKQTAKFIAEKSGAKVVVLPHEVNSLKNSKTLEDFYNVFGEELCN